MLKESFQGIEPRVHESCFVAPSAALIGNVTLEENVNVWYGAVLRGDVNAIAIGRDTNIQDNAVLHVADGYALTIGEEVTVGHGAIVHACTVGNRVLVGMGSIVLDGAVIEDDVILGAGSLVPPGKCIPSGMMAMGSPAKVVRALTDEERLSLMTSAQKYVALSKTYK